MAEEKNNLPDNMEQAEEAEPPPYSYPSQAFFQHPASTNLPSSHQIQPPCYSQQIPSYPQFPTATVQNPPPCGYDPDMPPYPQTQPQYYAPLPQHQQQTSNMVVLGGQTQFVYAPPRPFTSFACAIVLSVLVFFFCGYILGLIALVIALVGQCSADDGNARVLLRASYGFSIAGIVVGVIIYIIVFALLMTPTHSSSSSSSSISSPAPSSFGSYPNCGGYGYYYDFNYREACCLYPGAGCSHGYYYLRGIKTCCSYH